jgi:hypothetical protein
MIDGIEQNPKLGCYVVGDKTFYSKPDAHIYATETDQPVRWQFNDVAFAKYNWTVEPEGTINDIYRRRAQQLRDKYDYIRIEASGGGDSTTAVYSFLLNGIHLDEIVFRYPAQLDKDVTDNPLDTSPENTLSEFQFAARPLLHWVKTNYPKTKVTIHDYSEKILFDESTRDESWVFTTRDWFQPGHGDKHDHFGSAEHRALNDSGKSICVVHGVDKPKIALLDNHWYLFFTDMHPNGPTPIQNGYTNITTELFYWTPDMPEICAKQAHIIRRWFDMPQNQHLKHIIHHANVNADQRTTYENLIKTIIYPDYDPATWQTAKPTNSFYNEMDHWFYTNLKGSRLYSVWESGLQYLVDKIDKQYFVTKLGRPTGLILYRSAMYHIGAEDLGKTKNPVFKNSTYITGVNDFHYTVKDRKLKKVDK